MNEIKFMWMNKSNIHHRQPNQCLPEIYWGQDRIASILLTISYFLKNGNGYILSPISLKFVPNVQLILKNYPWDRSQERGFINQCNRHLLKYTMYFHTVYDWVNALWNIFLTKSTFVLDIYYQWYWYGGILILETNTLDNWILIILRKLLQKFTYVYMNKCFHIYCD